MVESKIEREIWRWRENEICDEQRKKMKTGFDPVRPDTAQRGGGRVGAMGYNSRRWVITQEARRPLIEKIADMRLGDSVAPWHNMDGVESLMDGIETGN
ncbi:hypothetical protein Sjap_011195 [Stephania japonica]|uniref:Uncharacterized protein n=1 Tax=Stephania japonica TaxID=461633 RepID=A0AAP0JB32_9MAGN